MGVVVFDLDGTLIDSAPDIRAAVNKMLAERNVAPLDLSTIKSFIGNGLPKLVERVMQQTELDPVRHSELTAITLAHYNAAATGLTRPYDGVIAALDALQQGGHTLALCTNKPEEPTRAILRDLKIASYFKVLVGGDTLEVRKPDPEPLRHILRRMGNAPSVYVGDSEVDAETAQRAGVQFLLHSQGYRKSPVDQISHQGVFSDFYQLEDLVQAALGKIEGTVFDAGDALAE